LPPAEDISPDSYWRERRRNEALKQEPRDGL
jgi:hypothetical protein